MTSTGSGPPVCLILGCGRGIGAGVASRFAEGGFHVVGVRRKDRRNEASKKTSNVTSKVDSMMSSQQRGNGGAKTSPMYDEISGVSTWKFFDVLEEAELHKNVDDIEKSIGPIHAMIYNLGANIGKRDS